MSVLLIDDIQVKAIAGLLPVCAWCIRVRDERQNWYSVSSNHLSRYEITHTICPECFEKMTSILNQS